MAYWLLRSEPETYGWDDLVRDGTTEWDGVRNYTARNFLKEMNPGDHALFYHSGKQKAAVGTMEVTRAWRPDGEKGEWASVAVKSHKPLAKPVTLAEIKAEPRLAELEVLRQSRLSVTPVRDAEWQVLMEMGGDYPPPVTPDLIRGDDNGNQAAFAREARLRSWGSR